MTSPSDTGTPQTREELIAGGRVIEAQTDLGPLLLEREAELLTPAVLAHGSWAHDISSFMRRHIRPGMTIVDAGANIGYVSVLASQLVGEEGRVYSVEVDPGNLPILRENLRHLGRDNWEILPVAAWHEEAVLNLVAGDAGGAGSFVREASEPGEGQVRAARLDELIDADVDYMKVDCENTDHFVVKGAENLIRRNPAMLISVEFNPDFTGHTEVEPREILDIYEGLGLKPWDFKSSGALKATSFDAIAARGGAEDGSILFDFALCAAKPSRARLNSTWFNLVIRDPSLRAGGRALDFVPAAIRPKIRHRDRS